MSTTAIVTLAVGRGYAERWRARCEPNWRTYADRHGYEVVCIDRPLDDSDRARSRSPAWQKCLVLSQSFVERYERVVWIDADVLINPRAPAITEGVPIERVGAVDEYATPTRELHRLTLAKLYREWEARGQPFVRNLRAREYYEAWGLPGDFDEVVQTGIMVLSPAHHRELLEQVYDRYDDLGPGLNYEMRPLSWELLAADLVSWLDPRFNYVWGSYKALHFPFLVNHPQHPDAAAAATQALHDVHCLHFAGAAPEIMLAGDLPPLSISVDPTSGRRPPPPARVRSAVAIAIFARPDTTTRVLEAVRRVRPAHLLVFGDAPRPGDPDEARRCLQTRALIDSVDWECELETRYAETHLGVREGISQGLDWVFSRAEEAIVLEDDCLPDPTFFSFADELLERYRDDERVMAISGNDFRFGGRPADASYSFSRYPLIWGWASWARAWRYFDPDLSDWPALRDQGWLERRFEDPNAIAYWTHLFDRVRRGMDTWDYAWTLACWKRDGLTALPNTNLVSNLGFRPDATHTRVADDYRSPFAALPTAPMAFPLIHPRRVERDEANDRFLEDVMFSGNLSRAFETLRALRAARELAS